MFVFVWKYIKKKIKKIVYLFLMFFYFGHLVVVFLFMSKRKTYFINLFAAIKKNTDNMVIMQEKVEEI